MINKDFYYAVIIKNLSAYNTRLFKTEVDGKRCYEVRLASAVKKGEYSHHLTFTYFCIIKCINL